MGMGMGIEPLMGFPFFKTFENPIHTDLHSHLLPAVDDGVKTVDEALEIIAKFHTLGYRKLIITPHIMGHMYQNTTDSILKAAEKLQKTLYNAKIAVDIAVSAEYYMDHEFAKLLTEGNLLPFGKNYLLFETAYQAKPMMMDDILFDMQSKGFQPVLAHPERYLYLQENFEEYYRLKEIGVKFQLNVKSFKQTRNNIAKTAIQLIDHGMVDFIGSDIHSIKEMHDFEVLIQKSQYKKIFRKNKLLNNTL